MGQPTWAGLPVSRDSWMDLKAGKFTYLAGEDEKIQTATDWHNQDPWSPLPVSMWLLPIVSSKVASGQLGFSQVRLGS